MFVFFLSVFEFAGLFLVANIEIPVKVCEVCPCRQKILGTVLITQKGFWFNVATTPLESPLKLHTSQCKLWRSNLMLLMPLNQSAI